MPPRFDRAWRVFERTARLRSFRGRRVKALREEELRPGGRVALSLFEKGPTGDRPHPRLRTSLPAAEDPAPPTGLAVAPEVPPSTAAAFEGWVRQARQQASARIDDVDGIELPEGSPRYTLASITAQRRATFHSEAAALLEGWLSSGTLPRAEAAACRYALRVLADEDLAGDHPFDDSDTGTYHSFGHDAPFVHYLEAILGSLPGEGTEAWSLLPAQQQESVRRQRRQATAHLDQLMRHKYAHDGVTETDVERTIGGFLIDRETRRVVSEDPESVYSLTPRHVLLRIPPAAAGDGSPHPHAGAPVYRDGEVYRLESDGSEVSVDASTLRSTPIPDPQLTFRRAPGDPGLRSGVRLDWDGRSGVGAEPIGWIGWAGHCDIKAIVEALGVTLADSPSVSEYRSDTQQTTVYDRDLLLEMLCSVLELGSRYVRTDGSGQLVRGLTRFGGARNDSRPDRLQFQGPGEGRSFRWPLGGRQERFRVTGLSKDGQQVDLDRAFFRWLPAEDLPEGQLDIVANPLFLKTVEGDYNLLDVSGAVLQVAMVEDLFDPETGYLGTKEVSLEIDLTEAGEGSRSYLGTWLKDVAEREVYRVFLDRTDANPRIVAEVIRYHRQDGAYVPVEVPEAQVVLPMLSPLQVTLSREMKRDNPAAFQALVEQALRHAQNICADTDMASEVWNGVVTHIALEKRAEDREHRTERWHLGLKARFGEAELEYLVKRDEEGEPVRYCPLTGEDSALPQPDFLWQDFPDVASKGFEQGDWIVNQAMLERGIVETSHDPAVGGETYVFDDHVKNVYELLFCGLSGRSFTIVHGNKRFAFEREERWKREIARLAARRAKVGFED